MREVARGRGGGVGRQQRVAKRRVRVVLFGSGFFGSGFFGSGFGIRFGIVVPGIRLCQSRSGDVEHGARGETRGCQIGERVAVLSAKIVGERVHLSGDGGSRRGDVRVSRRRLRRAKRLLRRHHRLLRRHHGVRGCLFAVWNLGRPRLAGVDRGAACLGDGGGGFVDGLARRLEAIRRRRRRLARGDDRRLALRGDFRFVRGGVDVRFREKELGAEGEGDGPFALVRVLRRRVGLLMGEDGCVDRV